MSATSVPLSLRYDRIPRGREAGPPSGRDRRLPRATGVVGAAHTRVQLSGSGPGVLGNAAASRIKEMADAKTQHQEQQ